MVWMSKQLLVYSRSGCHLCEDLIADLGSFEEFSPLPITVVDIDKDAELMKQFSHDVPVLTFGDELVCKHFFNPQALREVIARG